MAKELNSEFDIQARAQKHFEESVAEKVKNHQALNDDEIKLLCPVAFKDKMTKAEINKLGLSRHYSFVPTINVVNDLRALGYEVVDATQVKARKKSTNGYQKHLITLEHPKYKVEGNKEYPQILLTNSHDGGNAFTLSAGIFRLVCSNGLVIKTEDYGSARLVHKGYSFEAVQKLVKEFEVTVAEVLDKITAMKKVQLDRLATRTDAIIQLAESVPEPELRSFFAQSIDIKNKRWKLNLDVLEHEMEKIISFPQLLGQYEKASLFLSGALSNYLQITHRPSIKKLFPKAKFAKIPNAGHWLHAEKPREFEAVVRTFLSDF